MYFIKIVQFYRNPLETAFHETIWKKNFTVYPCINSYKISVMKSLSKIPEKLL